MHQITILNTVFSNDRSFFGSLIRHAKDVLWGNIILGETPFNVFCHIWSFFSSNFNNIILIINVFNNAFFAVLIIIG